MKIIHISVVRKITNGQRKQLESEYRAAAELEVVSWQTLAFDNFASNLPFKKQIPWLFRVRALRNLYGWMLVLYYSRKCDHILVRHMQFDPFSIFFAPLIKNRIPVHHGKDIEELRLIKADWRGKLASMLERFFGAFSLRYASAIAGVTGEIALYQKNRAKTAVETLMFANGIELEHIEVLADRREPEALHVAFVCGTFSPWHGLDRLMAAISTQRSDIGLEYFTIHLVGKVSESCERQIESDPLLKKIFRIHGFLEGVEYRHLLESCDIGLSSFALDRQGLTEACTLKVREMLALGLPVYSGHVDCAIPKEFPYYFYAPQISVEDMIEFCSKMKNYRRIDVANGARPYIDKKSIMESFADSVEALDV